MIALRQSMTKINNMGERGSPCLKPRRCEIDSPGTPLTMIWVEAV
uniref:Uncharacterized protein n=1 Tax=Arundo donax TaxID=35708 RepID=A0A0A9AK71_ARUDO